MPKHTTWHCLWFWAIQRVFRTLKLSILSIIPILEEIWLVEKHTHSISLSCAHHQMPWISRCFLVACLSLLWGSWIFLQFRCPSNRHWPKSPHTLNFANICIASYSSPLAFQLLEVYSIKATFYQLQSIAEGQDKKSSMWGRPACQMICDCVALLGPDLGESLLEKAYFSANMLRNNLHQ